MLVPTAGWAAKAQSVRAYAKHEAASHGWTGTHWRAIQEIVGRESGWDPCSVYPSQHDCLYAGGGTCGVPQTQPCPVAWRGRLWRTRYAQVRWLLDYILSRYGDPIHALSFQRAHGYY